MRRRWIGAALCLVIVTTAGWVWWTREERHRRALLEEARGEMSRGRFGPARISLSKLLDRWPGWAEAAYELGVCEQARGRVQAALDVWSRIPADSPLMGWVHVRRSRIEMDQGRFDDCETSLRVAAEIPGPHRAEARWGLVLLLRMQGRFDEARSWLQGGFDLMTDPVQTLQRLYKLDVDPFPTEGIHLALDRAGRQAPLDDRVWLGRAHLAIRLGQFAEAQRWLDRCLERRPTDPVVWRMKLEWALAGNRPDEALKTFVHLPAHLEPRSRMPSLRAWFAAQRGEPAAERKALEELLRLDPADARSLERLAQIELEEHRPEAAAELRRRKNELEAVRSEYVRRLSSERPAEHAAELARLAERLGRRFDAARWSEFSGGIRTAAVKSAASTSLSREQPTLADLLPDLVAPASSSPTLAVGPRTAPRFVDDAETVGLRFVQENGAVAGRLIPPVTSSGGVGLLDFDGDGWLDVYLVQGGTFPPDPEPSPSGDRLYRNRGDGTFEDVTVSSGIAGFTGGYGHGVAVGDFDNDGHADLFVTRWRSYALYRNRGDGTFEDVTEISGLGGDRDWPTSAAFADLDGDGDLDLYVCHYLKWDENSPLNCSDPNDPTIYRCSPLNFESLPDHLFRNDHGRFVDVTHEAGIEDRNGRGLGVLSADLDGDGRLDLFVANDMSANYLFHNEGGLKFKEIALTSGVANNASGAFQAGMGVACGDLDGDGLPDLAVTNFYNESTTFFRNLGQGFFGDRTNAVGLAAPSRYLLGFGISFLDVDNDGWLDLMTANGHVHDGRPQYPWMMPVQLLINNGGGGKLRLIDMTARAGPPFQTLRMGRALASGDLDNDGRIDALVVSQNQPLAYFHNQSAGGHFLILRLEGTTSNRDGVGAEVTLHCGGRPRIARRVGGGSYQAACDPRLHFGLGTTNRVDRADVRWPSGRTDHYTNLQADTGYLLREGESAAKPLPGWKR